MGTWTSIIVSHIGFRRRHPKDTSRKFPMPLYPWASWIVLAFIAIVAAIMATMLKMYIPIGFVCCFYALLGLIYGLSGAKRRGPAS